MSIVIVSDDGAIRIEGDHPVPRGWIETVEELYRAFAAYGEQQDEQQQKPDDPKDQT